MGFVKSNNIGLSYAREQSFGVLPGSPSWKLLEPNTIDRFGAEITTVERNPISPYRQRRKGTIVDLNSAVEFSADLTMDSFIDFMEGFCFSVAKGPATLYPSAATGSAFTVPSGGALAAGTLVVATGFGLNANNGLHVVDAGSSATSVVIVGGLSAETPTNDVTLEVAGVQGGTGDLEIDANGDLISSTLNFTTLGLTLGQGIWIGGEATATRFATAANRGFARIVAIAANKLTLDKRSAAFSVDDGSGKTIHIYFSKFIRNVAVSHADYRELYYQFETVYPGLNNPSGDMYEYSEGNVANSFTLNMPLTEKVTCNFSFLGKDTPVPVNTRKTNAASAIIPVRTGAFNTTSDFARIRIQEIDETGITSYFKNLTLTLNNNVAPAKFIGSLGALFMNNGNFLVDLEAELSFTDAAVKSAVRANRTVTLDFAMRNDQGGILFDIPELTLGGGLPNFPEDDVVAINTTAMAHGDSYFNHSLGVSIFAYLPAE